MLENRIIELSTGKIYVRHTLSHLIKAPNRDYVFDADGGAFMGGNGILQK